MFEAVDKLRGNMGPINYKHVALGPIFLEYISDVLDVLGRVYEYFRGPFAGAECIAKDIA